jgi:hypothetical protein
MKKIFYLVVSLIIAGCSSVKIVHLNPAASANIQGKSLVLVKRRSPDFIAMTSKKGMFAVVGVGAAVKAGNALVREKGIEDPALKIGRSVAQVLKSRYGMTVKGISRAYAESDDLGVISRLAAGQDYALDVATNGWSFIYDGFSFSDYLVGYSAKLRLIDVKAGKVLAEGLCIYDWKKAGKPTVSYEELMANDAAVIKKHLVESVDFCTRYYSKTLFQA